MTLCIQYVHTIYNTGLDLDMRSPRFRWRLGRQEKALFSSTDQIPAIWNPLELVPGDYPVSGKSRPLLTFSRTGNLSFQGVQPVLDYLNSKGNPFDLPRLGGESIVGRDDYEWFFEEFERLRRGELPPQRFELIGNKIVPVNGRKAAFIFGKRATASVDPEVLAQRQELMFDLLAILNEVRPISVEIPFFFKGVISRKEDYEILNHYLSVNSRNKTDWRSLVAKSA